MLLTRFLNSKYFRTYLAKRYVVSLPQGSEYMAEARRAFQSYKTTEEGEKLSEYQIQLVEDELDSWVESLLEKESTQRNMEMARG